MLLQFRFSNFRSFKAETVLDMRASGSNEYSEHVRLEGVDKVLPVAAIYGANGSGKSNIFRALSDMIYYILVSFAFDDQINVAENHFPREMVQAKFPFEPHFFQKEKPVSYEVYFTMPYKSKTLYFKYGFSLDADGITEEWLGKAFKTDIEKGHPYKMLFERRRGKKLLLAGTTEKYRENIELSLQEKVLLLSLGTKLKMELLSDVYQWFKYFLFLTTQEKDERFRLYKLAQNIFDDKQLKRCVLDYIRSFDTSIQGFDVIKSPYVDNSSFVSKRYQLYFIHVDRNGNRVEIPLEDESAGTIKMITLFQKLQDGLQYGGICLADELDIQLHPLLVRNIILNFTDPERNPKHAQLIFTTHNTIYMDMGLLRRDEIWFTEKKDNISELYSLDDIQDANGNKIRKDANYAKNYLLGKYGAIPQLSELMKGNSNV